MNTLIVRIYEETLHSTFQLFPHSRVVREGSRFEGTFHMSIPCPRNGTVRVHSDFHITYFPIVGWSTLIFERLIPFRRTAVGDFSYDCESESVFGRHVSIEKVGLTPKEFRSYIKAAILRVLPKLQADRVDVIRLSDLSSSPTTLARKIARNSVIDLVEWNAWSSYSGRVRRL